jgi:hypothetical protein
MKLKFCYMCKETKSIDLFYNDNSHPDGKSTRCKKCDYKYKMDWIKKNPERAKVRLQRKLARAKARNPNIIKNRDLKCKYGITFDEFEKLRKQQDYRCLICKIHQDDLEIALNVDHDEKLNIVRGLLCNPCNRAIGEFQHSLVIIKKAIEYLQKYD